VAERTTPGFFLMRDLRDLMTRSVGTPRTRRRMTCHGSSALSISLLDDLNHESRRRVERTGHDRHSRRRGSGQQGRYRKRSERRPASADGNFLVAGILGSGRERATEPPISAARPLRD
jgi:hypothetical protein